MDKLVHFEHVVITVGVVLAVYSKEFGLSIPPLMAKYVRKTEIDALVGSV